MRRMQLGWPVWLAALMTLTMALAQDTAGPAPEAGRGPGQGVAMYQYGERASELTATGAVITITSADPALAQQLIAHHTDRTRPQYGLPAGVTRTTDALPNGVRITLTGATDTDVAWIHQRHATLPVGPPLMTGRAWAPGGGWGYGARPGYGAGPGWGYGAGPGLRLQAGPAAGYPAPQRTVELLDRGARVKVTSDLPEQVALLQQRAADAIRLDGPLAGQVQRQAENLANGVQVTLTSDDPATVQWLQTTLPAGPQGPRYGAGYGAGYGYGRGARHGGGYGYGRRGGRR